jgi:hypothetical protein
MPGMLLIGVLIVWIAVVPAVVVTLRLRRGLRPAAGPIPTDLAPCPGAGRRRLRTAGSLRHVR